MNPTHAVDATGATCGPSRVQRGGWPVERVLFALAGTMVLLAAALTALVSQWFLLLAVFVALNQWLYVLIGNCPASMLLTRLFGLPRAITR